MINLDMIGSKISGAVSSSVSKWEKSFFGGFYRLVVDYPSIKIDDNVELDPAPSPMGFFEKEKILKIFLSQSKQNDLIDDLMYHPKTLKEVNFAGQSIIKTIVSRKSKIDVLDSLIKNTNNEYGPLFEHYKKFIIDSEISFSRNINKSSWDDSSDSSENGSDKKNNSKKNKDKNDGNGKQKSSDKKNKNDKDGNGKEKSKSNKQKNEKNKSCSKGNSDDKNSKPDNEQQELENVHDMAMALEKTTERKTEFKFLTSHEEKPVIEIQDPYLTKTRFTKKQKDIADKLVNLLDISFDQTEDTVKNLRIGKLDICKIAEVPAGNIAIYKQSVENQTTKPFSVVILCDESGSMTASFGESISRLQAQHSIVKSMYMAFSDIIPQEKIFIYGHGDGDETKPHVFVYQDKYNNNFENTIDRMISRDNGANYDGPAIEGVYKHVRGFTNDRIIFIILSDGAPNGSVKRMKQIIEKCKRDEFMTIGIGMETLHVKDLYQYSTIVNNMDEMPKKVSHIINHVVKTEFQ